MARAGADGQSDVPDASNSDHPLACYPLFHACGTTDECCAPNRCLSITGTPACQQEGPALDADGSEPVSDAAPEDGGQDATACYPLFHACTSSGQCCAPNLCLSINGPPTCQIEAEDTHAVHELDVMRLGRWDVFVRWDPRVPGGRGRILFRPRQSASAGLRDRR